VFLSQITHTSFMEIIYKNGYGAIYSIKNSPNPECTLQLVMETVGLFMSRADLEHLLKIAQKPFEPCHCEQCRGKIDKIWSTNSIIDICLKVNKPILEGIEDLIKGALFNLDMDATLLQNNLTAKES
ncbi:MAG: hypothetical protein AAFO99_05500, partial [Bacteroidota bacterium]